MLSLLETQNSPNLCASCAGIRLQLSIEREQMSFLLTQSQFSNSHQSSWKREGRITWLRLSHNMESLGLFFCTIKTHHLTPNVCSYQKQSLSRTSVLSSLEEQVTHVERLSRGSLCYLPCRTQHSSICGPAKIKLQLLQVPRVNVTLTGNPDLKKISHILVRS